ncbi:Protein of unknown function [Thermobacillus xylanilyticus]|uniref:Uncharacterized protein n=1 Tax=Thermobacillus xylanilyticus TaxID=76633 RepID=A0ABN7RTE3_THEXY|nr:Protein of unknown function [Thermobacillus xylanilyticus]
MPMTTWKLSASDETGRQPLSARPTTSSTARMTA